MTESMTLAEAQARARELGGVFLRQAEEIGRLRAELARRDTTIAAVQAEIEREWDRGNITVAPIAAALSAPVEAGTDGE